MRHIWKTKSFVDFVKHESVRSGLWLKHGNNTDIENSITVQVIIIFESWEVCHELLRNISLSSINNAHGNYSQWSRHLLHSQDSEFRVSSVHVGFIVGRMAVGQAFFPEYCSFFRLSTQSHQRSMLYYQLTALFNSILTVHQYEWRLVASEVRWSIAKKVNMQVFLRNLLLHQQGKLYTILVKEVLITKNITNSNRDTEMKLK